MTLPVLKSLPDCASYAKTVEPFYVQLYALPYKLMADGLNLERLARLYTGTNPMVSGFAFSVFVGAVCLVASEINRNYSQVDRLWSILPNLYVVHVALWARLAGLPHARLDLIAAFTSIWSLRLTYNYWRRGGYKVGSEDYRWEIIKGKVPKPVFFIFNLTFISFIQSILLFSFSGPPAYLIMLSSQFESQIQFSDIVFFAVETGLVLSEWISDGQQWNFHNAKSKYQKTKKVSKGYTEAGLQRGFNTVGLWKYSRHPNFAAEQTIWFVLYQWSCYATKTMYNWSGLGSVALILLFQGSTWLTELISTGKYPQYKEYQKQVGRFIPTSLTGYRYNPKVIRASDLKKEL